MSVSTVCADLERVRAHVRVVRLGGDELTFQYENLSVMHALVNAHLQMKFRNFNTWTYARFYAEFGPLVRIGPSGRTASLFINGTTYSTHLAL